MKRLHPKSGTDFKDYISKCAPIVFFSALTGALSGTVVVLYNLCAEFLQEHSQSIYQLVYAHPAFIPLLVVALVFLAFISYVILKYVPEAQGAGVPRTEGVLRGHLPIVWWRTLIGTVFASFIAFFSGISLGSEGPSTALGASVGAGVSKLHRSKKLSEADTKEVSLMIATSGSSAGMAAAFNAPVAGLIFTLEELHQRFSPMILLAASSAIITSIATSTALKYALGLPIVALETMLHALPFQYIWTLIILGVLCGVLSALFTKVLSGIGEFKFIKRIPLFLKILIAFIVTGTVGLFLTDALGGGFILVHKLISFDFKWWILIALLLSKIFLTVLGVGSRSSGGLLIPTLTIGALLGALMGKLFIVLGVPQEYYNTFIVISMSAFLGAMFRTPITAIVLMVEITGSLSGMLTLGIEVLIAYVVSELLMRKPIYDTLLERDIEAEENLIIPRFSFALKKKK